MGELVTYYRERASEYERVYEKPERRADLERLHEIIPAFFTGRRVLEIACGTGYWTRRISALATSIIALDLVPETLAIGRSLQPEGRSVDYRIGDAFDLMSVPGDVDAAFAGFWWSHVRHVELQRFLSGVEKRLPPGSPVLIVDNRYVEGSNWPVTRTDAEGNTYQRRLLENGTEHEVLKNFPSGLAVHAAIAGAGGQRPYVEELTYFWYATYLTNGAAGPTRA